MNLTTEVTRILHGSGRWMTQGDILRELSARGMIVRESTLANHLRARTKMDGGHDIVRCEIETMPPRPCYKLRGEHLPAS